jgi:hypothetical protein
MCVMYLLCYFFICSKFFGFEIHSFMCSSLIVFYCLCVLFEILFIYVASLFMYLFIFFYCVLVYSKFSLCYYYSLIVKKRCEFDFTSLLLLCFWCWWNCYFVGRFFGAPLISVLEILFSYFSDLSHFIIFFLV